MQINKDNNRINFGWNAVTHKMITQTAVNTINKAYSKNPSNRLFNVNNLMKGSVLPDIEKHLPGSHSADIFNPRKGDALENFKRYEKLILKELKMGKCERLEFNIGRALHFLQDMQNPKHVIFSPRQSKADKINHKHFEDSAVKIQNATIKEARNLYSDKREGFEKILQQSLEQTSNNAHLPKRIAQTAHCQTKLKQKGLINSYNVTYEFLAKIAELLK